MRIAVDSGGSSPAPFRLDGRRALVTGATGGIGQAIAARLRAQGATLVVSGTRQDALDRLAEELGGGATAIAARLDRPGEAARLAAAAGPIDILVNNAGISRREPLDQTGDEHWREVMAINLDACFALARALVPAMAGRGWGRAIGIGSILGTTAASGMAAYCAAKAGLVAMHKALALDFAASGVTANVVAPGYIRTPMMDMNPPETKRAILDRIPCGFFGEPEDVAGAVLYLASEEARFVTGATLHINGGMAMD